MEAQVGRDSHHPVAQATLSGVDPARLLASLGRDVRQGDRAGPQRSDQRPEKALDTAQKYGDKASIKTVTDQLNAALGAIDDAGHDDERLARRGREDHSGRRRPCDAGRHPPEKPRSREAFAFPGPLALRKRPPDRASAGARHLDHRANSVVEILSPGT
jgi:hypothetical protein